MRSEHDVKTNAAGLRVGLVVSRYHSEITAPLQAAAVEMFKAAGGLDSDLDIVEVPGAFELTGGCRMLAERGDVDAVVALGCVLTGETNHDRYIASAVAHGLTMITVGTGVPVAFGVLTCQSMAQARERAGGAHGNKGAEAMTAALHMAKIARAGDPVRSKP